MSRGSDRSEVRVICGSRTSWKLGKQEGIPEGMDCGGTLGGSSYKSSLCTVRGLTCGDHCSAYLAQILMH